MLKQTIKPCQRKCREILALRPISHAEDNLSLDRLSYLYFFWNPTLTK